MLQASGNGTVFPPALSYKKTGGQAETGQDHAEGHGRGGARLLPDQMAANACTEGVCAEEGTGETGDGNAGRPAGRGSAERQLFKPRSSLKIET